MRWIVHNEAQFWWWTTVAVPAGGVGKGWSVAQLSDGPAAFVAAGNLVAWVFGRPRETMTVY